MTRLEQQEKYILVVDDSADNLSLMKLMLESEGYKVDTADSGPEALRKIKKCHPSLVLLDIMMPRMNGYEVIARLRKDKSLPFIRVYFVTADKYTEERQAIAAGADGLIYKPVDLHDLLLKVGNTLNVSKSF